MKRVSIAVLALCALAGNHGCKAKKIYPAAEYMAFEQVEFVSDFPLTQTLGGGETIDLDLLGTIDLKVQDSLLVVATQDNLGMWSFFAHGQHEGLPHAGHEAPPEFRPLGKYLVKGRGPNEFPSSMPWVSGASFFGDGGQLMALIQNADVQKLYTMNVSQTMRTDTLAMTETATLPESLSTMIRLDAGTIFCRGWGNDDGVRNRFLLRDFLPDTTHHKALDMLNSARVELLSADGVTHHEYINVIGAHVAAQPGGSGRMVEAGLMLNRLNIYDIKGDLRKTICVDGTDLESIAEVCRTEERKYFYANLNAYPEFFVALWEDITDTQDELGTGAMPELLFFDWQGKPLTRITVPARLTSFDIDFATGQLYTINANTEEIVRYDISGILEGIRS